jgi:hypothetical protein
MLLTSITHLILCQTDLFIQEKAIDLKIQTNLENLRNNKEEIMVQMKFEEYTKTIDMTGLILWLQEKETINGIID